jgi:lysophospholipase L1-like esterase
MKSFLRLSLVLLLLLASRHPAFCDDTNHNFAVWEKAISAYERMDATNPPPKGALVFIGASSIGHWKTLAQDFPGQPVVNRGFGGSGIADSTHFADRIIVPYAPRMVFLRAGGNDLWAGKSPEEVCADFKEFAETVHAKLPEAEIIYISQSPSLARWKQHEKEKALNALVADYIQGKSYLKYIETYDMVLGADGQPRADLFIADHLHFNDAGNKLMAERVRPYLPK